jgi:RNA-directed DNA polymerase
MPVEGRVLTSGMLIDVVGDGDIGDEPDKTRKDPDAAEKAPWQGPILNEEGAEPEFRFYQLYDKVWRDDILAHAYALARDNRGAPGVDGVTFAMIEEQGSEAWLAALQAELRAKTYRSQPVRRVTIPKPGGGERPLGIPTIQDRVVQTAVKLVIEPIFEADFEPNTHGCRPKRSATDAIRQVHGLLLAGDTDVVDADLSKYFGAIPHDELIQCVARRIVDRQILALIKMWLKTPAEEKDRDGTRRITGGKSSKKGTPPPRRRRVFDTGAGSSRRCPPTSTST